MHARESRSVTTWKSSVVKPVHVNTHLTEVLPSTDRAIGVNERNGLIEIESEIVLLISILPSLFTSGFSWGVLGDPRLAWVSQHCRSCSRFEDCCSVMLRLLIPLTLLRHGGCESSHPQPTSPRACRVSCRVYATLAVVEDPVTASYSPWHGCLSRACLVNSFAIILDTNTSMHPVRWHSAAFVGDLSQDNL
jgi:hypothetical protein